jgi:predicted dehydrogenase
MAKKRARSQPVRVTMIGCGIMAGYHLQVMLPQFKDTVVPVVCEPAKKRYEAIAKIFAEAGRDIPPNEPNLYRLLDQYADQLDVAFIITPHVFHHDQTKACLEAGLDVLLEKPMVMSVAEARSLIDIRDRTGRHLVVAFNGGLSPEIRTAAEMIRSGQVGTLQSISATVWQNWRDYTANTWRQVPEMAGGGFLFDTGAHMLNTVTALAGEEFEEVSAWLDNRGTPVDIIGTVMGRLASGALVTMHGSGETVPSCDSDVRVFCSEAILRTGVWGRYLEIMCRGEKTYKPVKVSPSSGAWQQFLAVRRGELTNPCPPEVGLRMSRLWDAIRASSAQGGQSVLLKDY